MNIIIKELLTRTMFRMGLGGKLLKMAIWQKEFFLMESWLKMKEYFDSQCRVVSKSALEMGLKSRRDGGELGVEGRIKFELLIKIYWI